jgi:hypothetical protein
MTIVLEIPDNIYVTLNELGLTKPKITNVFRHYLEQMMEDGYGQFNIDFTDWLEDLTDEEFTDIQNGHKL